VSRDLDDRTEVAEFVVRFYREIAQDERFHYYFETLAGVDWNAHTRDLTDFWAGLLFGEPHPEADVVIESHRWLHETTGFDASLFEQWLEVFETVLDDGWSGPVAEQARRRANGYAWAMAKRLVGVDLRKS